MTERKTKPLFTFPGAPKDPFDPQRRAETLQKLASYEAARREARQALGIEVSQVVVTQTDPSPAPLRILHFSDWHLFSDASSAKDILRLEAELAKPGTVAVLYGDMIEGLFPTKVDITTQVAYDFHDQITIFKERYLRPWVEQGKVLAVVGGYDSHEGWAKRLVTVDAIRLMVEGLKQPDGTPLQIITQDGRLIIRRKNGQEYIVRVYHDPGSGGSDDLNPLGAQRKRNWAVPIDAPDHHHAVVGGHWHHRRGVSEEVTRLATGIDCTQTLIANGTLKGTTDGDSEPDDFLQAKSKGPSKMGSAATILFTRDRKIIPWTVLGADKGAIINQAARVWDRAESQHLTESIIARARDTRHKGKINVTFDRERSKVDRRNPSGRSHTPLYDILRYQVDSSSLPVAVCVIANARYGSTSTNRSAIAEAVNLAVDRQGFYLLGGRHLVDSRVSHDKERRTFVLDKMVAALMPAARAGKLLAVMLSKSLREDAWKKDYGEFYLGISTGDYISAAFRQGGDNVTVPLYVNESRIEMQFNHDGPQYRALVLDGLDQSGSSLDPFRGLVRSHQLTRMDYEIVTGGNVRGVGVMDDGHTTYVTPGWFADWDTRGKINARKLPSGGNGWIMYPDRQMVFSAPTFAELRDRHQALTLLAATEILGIKLEDIVARKGR